MAVLPIANAFDSGERRRLGGFYGAVAGLHILGWSLLLLYGMRNPAFIGLGALAYTFGLRHAFDADHISAIDNATRKLLQERKQPVGTGFFFSLGHSSVVFLLALALGIAARTVAGMIGGNGQLSKVSTYVGTSVSGTFLILIGLLNLAVLLDIFGVYRRMRSGQYDKDSLQHELIAGGLMTRLFKRLFSLVGESWHMYPIGFLFGLGFDTATEVAFLAISAGAAANGLPIYAVLALPIIFAAGMSLMDTADGAFMAKAYGWAFASPVRKVFYNMTITGLSVFVALFVGLVEVGQIFIHVTNARGGVWDVVAGLNFNVMGFIIVAAFILTWVAALAFFKLRHVEERWGALVEAA
ncbi:MAG TPA: HoxN/HupN/NixA family nickel/cobalt transporter [Solirubrobacterales bacterium]|nr:HoxN/HupN/NixA family nickel/cobalt transporter [Solirubrobacterales bacterium]